MVREARESTLNTIIDTVIDDLYVYLPLEDDKRVRSKITVKVNDILKEQILKEGNNITYTNTNLYQHELIKLMLESIGKSS